jgi:hypothetical protein
MQKEKRVERVGYEQSNSLPLPTIWIVGHRDLPLQRVEVVGSNPTRSTFVNLVEYGIELSFFLDGWRTNSAVMPLIDQIEGNF